MLWLLFVFYLWAGLTVAQAQYRNPPEALTAQLHARCLESAACVFLLLVLVWPAVLPLRLWQARP